MKKNTSGSTYSKSCSRSVKWLMLLTMLFVGGFTYGQNTVGAIVGTATTPDGSAIQGAQVTVVNQATHNTQVWTTGSSGQYSAPALNPGTYEVTASAPGFNTIQINGIVVGSQQTVGINLHFKLGSTSTRVVVTGGTPVINTEMPSISNTLNSAAITKSSSNLFGTVDATGNSGVRLFINLLPSGHQNVGSSWSMYGSSQGQAYYNVDGISSNSTLFGNSQGTPFPSFDMIQEVMYDAVDNKAEMGQLLNVTVITKSGTNQFHGSLFENFANQKLVAQNYFSTSNPPFTNNDFGGGGGGPIVRNKAFFFVSYEGFRNSHPTNINSNFPTESFRTGDFSSLLSRAKPIVIKNPYTGLPFAGNIIPQNLLSSPESKAAQAWQAMIYPAPNFGTPDSFNGNYRGTFSQKYVNDRFDTRVDMNLTPKNSAFVRFSRSQARPHVLDSAFPPATIGYRSQVRTTYSGVLSDTWILSPNLINVAKVGMEWSNNKFGPHLKGQAIVDQLGIQLPETAPASLGGYPLLSISSITSPSYPGPNDYVEQNKQVIDQVTYQRGTHTIKTGVEWRPQYGKLPFSLHFGHYKFNGAETGFGYADFLLGLPQSTSYQYTTPSQYELNYFVSMFLQDDWRARPNLTLSYGIRYDLQSVPRDKHNNISNFDPRNGALVVNSLANVGPYLPPGFPTAIPIETAAEAHFPTPGLRKGFHGAIFPRLGFAWSINNDTVLRGGYGVYNIDITSELIGDYLYQAPFGGNVAYTNSLPPYLGGQPAITFTQPINAAMGSLGAIAVSGIDQNLRNAYVQQWNLTLERNIGFNTGVRVSYVGSKGSDLLYGKNLNQVPASATVPWSQNNVAYPNYQSVIWELNGGSSSYNALEVEVRRQMQKNLSFFAAVSWQKNLTNDPQDQVTGNGDFFYPDPQGGAVAENTYDLHQQWGNEQYTPTLQFTSNVLYNLPIGPGQFLLKENNIWSKILGGWQLSAAFVANTGQHLTPVFEGVDPTNINAFGGSASKVPGVSSSPVGHRSIDNWFNPASYSVPAPGQFGNAGYGTLTGPGTQFLNARLFKSFPMPRQGNIEVSGSFTNVLNHPNFGNPDVTVTDATVGKITTTQGGFNGPRAGLLTVRYNF